MVALEETFKSMFLFLTWSCCLGARVGVLENSLTERPMCGTFCAGREGVNKKVTVAARIVENGLSHLQDCILHSENCLPLPFPEPLSKPVSVG